MGLKTILTTPTPHICNKKKPPEYAIQWQCPYGIKVPSNQRILQKTWRMILWDPRSGMTPKWGFGVAMLPVGALCFYQAHFGRTVLPKWPLWAHLFYSVFYSVSELRRACFRQARVARAVLPPGALFRAGALALPPSAPKSHMRLLPHLGFSMIRTQNYGIRTLSFMVRVHTKGVMQQHAF